MLKYLFLEIKESFGLYVVFAFKKKDIIFVACFILWTHKIDLGRFIIVKSNIERKRKEYLS